MAKVLMPLGDATEALDTFYPFFRLKEAGYEVVVAGPEARLYHTVLHEIPPDSSIPWDITQERPAYFIKADVAFKDINPEEYAGVFISGGRAPEYIRYDEDLNRVVKAIHDAGKPVASVCHGIEILTSAGIIQGRNVTTVAKCAMDAEQGGGNYVDQETVVDRNIVSARTWHDNAPLMKTFLEMLNAATAKD
ncbi:MAG: DJ-1/PfpI family protein [Planctomycetaceae bacterium]|nr:peptidase [Planctomycetaceae bacterium]|tara:strand:- start:880 stop:1455 length:576 start_codon:yes stop_codon:yes gene_type:complete